MKQFVIVACAQEVDETYSALGIFEVIFFEASEYLFETVV